MADSRSGLLSDPRWERLAGAGGIVFVALSIVWGILISDAPGFDDSDAEITSFYADGGDSGRVFLASILLGWSPIFLLWFLGSLRSMLRRAEGDTGRLSAVAFGAGIALASLVWVKVAVTGAVAAAVEYSDTFTADPDTVKFGDAVFLWLLSNEGVAGGVLIAATSVIALRTGVFPAWLAWAGLAVALVSFFAGFLFGLQLFLLLAWILVVSLFMLRGAGRAPSIAPAS